ncbi:MAG: hypothetical protein WCP89_00080 [archaeon]
MVNTLEQTAETSEDRTSTGNVACSKTYCTRQCQYQGKRIPAADARNYGAGPVCLAEYDHWASTED